MAEHPQHTRCHKDSTTFNQRLVPIWSSRHDTLAQCWFRVANVSSCVCWGVDKLASFTVNMTKPHIHLEAELVKYSEMYAEYIVASELNDLICHSNECQIGSFSSEATICAQNYTLISLSVYYPKHSHYLAMLAMNRCDHTVPWILDSR